MSELFLNLFNSIRGPYPTTFGHLNTRLIWHSDPIVVPCLDSTLFQPHLTLQNISRRRLWDVPSPQQSPVEGECRLITYEL